MVCFVLESVAATHEVVENSRDSAGGLLVEGVEVAVQVRIPRLLCLLAQGKMESQACDDSLIQEDTAETAQLMVQLEL